jgi:hypothetical protein
VLRTLRIALLKICKQLADPFHLIGRRGCCETREELVVARDRIAPQRRPVSVLSRQAGERRGRAGKRQRGVLDLRLIRGDVEHDDGHETAGRVPWCLCARAQVMRLDAHLAKERVKVGERLP